MTDLSDIFSSKARVKALRTLYYQNEPLPLRQIAYLSETPLFSIQRVLQQLMEEEIIIEKKQDPFRLFSLNKQHASYPLINHVFEGERKLRAKPSLDQKAQNLLKFVNDAGKTLQVAKQKR